MHFLMKISIQILSIKIDTLVIPDYHFLGYSNFTRFYLGLSKSNQTLKFGIMRRGNSETTYNFRTNQLTKYSPSSRGASSLHAFAENDGRFPYYLEDLSKDILKIGGKKYSDNYGKLEIFLPDSILKNLSNYAIFLNKKAKKYPKVKLEQVTKKISNNLIYITLKVECINCSETYISFSTES